MVYLPSWPSVLAKPLNPLVVFANYTLTCPRHICNDNWQKEKQR